MREFIKNIYLKESNFEWKRAKNAVLLLGWSGWFLLFFVCVLKHMAMHGTRLSRTVLLSAPSWLYPSTATPPLYKCFWFHCDKHLTWFLKKETTREPQKKKQSPMNVHSAAETWNILKSISELCVGLGCPGEEPHLYSNVLQSSQFYFSIENIHCGWMGVLCKSKVVHFNTTACQHFFSPPLFV